MIGASRPCELQLEDPTVAKIHASLVLTARGLWIVNLVGDDRTRVDGKPVRWQRLESGNELKIGKFRFRVQYVSYPANSRPCSFQLQGERPRTESDPLSATGGNGISEAFVLGLMSQMAAMQQQFLEHSQQQMLMTAQLLTSLRSPQHGVDEELARVQELTRELQTLRGQMAGELARRPPPSIPTAPDVAPIVTTNSAVGLAAPTPTETVPVLTPTESDLVEKPAEAVTTSEGVGMQPQMDSQGEVDVGPPPPPDNPAAEPVEQRQRRTHAAVEMHAALIERMANLESERTSRWSKIIGALMGNRQ